MYYISLNMFVFITVFTSIWTFSGLFILRLDAEGRRGFKAEQGQEKKYVCMHVLEFKLLSADKIFLRRLIQRAPFS